MSERAYSVLVAAGLYPDTVQRALQALAQGGLELADTAANEMVCRWVDVRERAVPPEADTIIRTITRTLGEQSSSTTHWLHGLRGPLAP